MRCPRFGFCAISFSHYIWSFWCCSVVVTIGAYHCTAHTHVKNSMYRRLLIKMANGNKIHKNHSSSAESEEVLDSTWAHEHSQHFSLNAYVLTLFLLLMYCDNNRFKMWSCVNGLFIYLPFSYVDVDLSIYLIIICCLSVWWRHVLLSSLFSMILSQN